MRVALTATLVAMLAPAAAAQPAAPPTPAATPAACSVEIVRAPDDVRAVVEEWVRAEPRCGVTLEVRVVPTDGGYYLFARDERGRLHERVVPDATSAGVLVASWAADDSPAPPAPVPVPAAVTPPAAAAVPAPAFAMARSGAAPAPIAPPSMTEVSAQADVAVAPPRARRFVIGGMAPLVERAGSGVRASLDVWTHGAWAVGGAASYARSAASGMFTTSDSVVTADADLAVYVARTSRLGPWSVTPSVGVGARYSFFQDVYSPTETVSSSGFTQLAVGSLAVAYHLGDHLEVDAGPVVTVHPDLWDLRQNVDVTVFAGIGWGL